ncbi:hypothetical protein C8R44DRAFT_890777 [Mycena epipterygia]|nr:hypothetical protein C8R44DRAFT_890777 [Mycena epipterygia]
MHIGGPDIVGAPFNIETSLEFLNNYIRADTENKTPLLTKMRTHDINMIREAGAGCMGRTATNLRPKMATEEMFRLLWPLVVRMEQQNEKFA